MPPMNLAGLLTNKVVVAVLAFVVSTGAALGVSRALTGGGEEAVLPEAAGAVPLVAPVETGPIPTADDPAGPSDDGSGGGGTDGGGSGGGTDDGGSGGGTGADSTAPPGAESLDYAGEVRDLGGPGGGVDGSTPGTTGFVDLCAGATPGEDPPDGCPDPSTAGTILPLSGDAPLRQTVQFLRVPNPFGFTTRCSVRVDEDNAEPWAVVATNPGTIQIQYSPRPRGVRAPPTIDPDTVVTIEGATDVETSSEFRLWRGWFESGSVGIDATHHVQHCVVLRDLVPGQEYAYQVTSTDIFGSTDTEVGAFRADDNRRRPPVTINYEGGSQVVAHVPVRTGERERAVAFAVPTSGSRAQTCTELEEADLGISSGGERSAISATDREADGYPWDPDYDETMSIQVREPDRVLAEGRTYAVCIWWISGPARSFDVDRITEREQRQVTMPNRFRVRVTLEAITFTRSVPAEGVEFDIRGLCGSHVVPEGVVRVRETVGRRVSVTQRYDEVLCDLTEDRSGHFVDALDMRVTGPFEQTLTSRLDVSARPGPETTDSSSYYALNIPAEQAVARLCGSFAGDGSCGDPPPRNESVGTARVRVDLIDGPNEGGDGVNVGPEGSFAGSDEPEVEPPPYAQIDQFSSRARTIPERFDALEIVVNLDRPATVRAYVDPFFAAIEPPCLQPGASGSASSGPAERHRFVLDGLCEGRTYNIALEITDTTGSVSSAAFTESPASERETWWRGRATVASGLMRITTQLSVLATPEPTPDTESYLCGEYSIEGMVQGTSLNVDVGAVGPPRRVDVARGDRSIVVTADYLVSFTGRCHEPDARTSLRATLDVAELLARPITLTSPTDDTLRVQLEISATLISR